MHPCTQPLCTGALPHANTPHAQVPAGGRAEFSLTYKPLTMAPPERPHQGTVFFPIPDGTGLLYNLTGQVGPGRRGRRHVATLMCHQAWCGQHAELCAVDCVKGHL